jgi:hypothetical protein
VQGGEVVTAAIECQPALALDEAQEHQAVEEHLREHAPIVFRELRMRQLDRGFSALEGLLIVVVKALGDLLDIEGPRPLRRPLGGGS